MATSRTHSDTRFFAEPALFDALERVGVPSLFARKGRGDTIRVGVPGCGTGADAYSLAMLLLEEAERRRSSPEILLFATDTDASALEAARAGAYAREAVARVGPQRLDRFFIEGDEEVRVSERVRDRVVFALHEALRDPAYLRLDLICVPGGLIRLERGDKRAALERFHHALRPAGVLALGGGPCPDPESLFAPIEGAPCLYHRRDGGSPGVQLPDDLEGMANGGGEVVREVVAMHRASELHARMVERYAPPSVLVDAYDRVVHISASAGRFLRHAGGEPSSRLERLVAPELRHDVAMVVRQAREAGEPRSTAPIPVSLRGGSRAVEAHARPASSAAGDEAGHVLVLFEEREPGAAESLAARASQVEVLESELESTRERLATALAERAAREEEASVTAQELKAANHELEQALQDLDSHRQELQDANQQLRVLAQENEERADELNILSRDLERLLVATEIGTLFLDTELRIVRYTPRMGYLFHLRPMDVGRPISDLSHRLEYPELLEDAHAVLSGGEPREREVVADEDTFFLARFLPHWSSEGELDGVVLVVVDITSRKRAEQAEEESRIKSQFLSTMSHELRTPLTAVIGVADLMETGVVGPMNDKQKHHLSRIKAAAWHLVRIIEEVLSFSRSEAGKEEVTLEDVELAGAVRDVVDMVGPAAAAAEVEVSVYGVERPLTIHTDRGKLTQILTNLLGNASKFAGSAVAVTLEVEDSAVEVRVRDDGPGIPGDRREEIFEPFNQLDNSSTRAQGGTGLGLTIARRQARLLGGDVTVESVEGEGSTFTLRLPREAGAPEDEAV